MKDKTETKKGYKKTKLGWIPEDWNISTFENVAILIRGPFGGTLKKEIFVNDGYKVYEQKHAIYNDFKLGKYFITEQKFLELKRFAVKPGNFLMSCSGTAGKFALVPENAKDGIINQALLKISIKDSIINPFYFNYYANSNLFQNQLFRDFAGGAIKNIASIPIIKKIKILLPPLTEQQKIAQILSTWHRAIEKYKLLIKKYELRKKGLMQQLLSGKRRFREFEGSEWKAVKLGDNTICFSGGTPSRSKKEYYNGEIPWIKSGELNHDKIYNTEEFITNEGLKNSSAKIVEEETILVALYGATAGVVAVTMVEAAINQAVLAILPSKIIDKYFLLYKLKFIMPHVVENMVQGGQPNLSGTIVKGVRINIPVKKNEQQKIVSVISSADKEIEMLKHQLEKLKEQKKGLMQVLLTGKIRAISPLKD